MLLLTSLLLIFSCLRIFWSFSFLIFFLFFFNDTATTEIYTLSLHDALPISPELQAPRPPAHLAFEGDVLAGAVEDRKSTRLNSSHANISYAVFCLKKKKKKRKHRKII